MSKAIKSKIKVGDMQNAATLREIADKMEAGKICGYAVVVLEKGNTKLNLDGSLDTTIEVRMNAGVKEHDEGIYQGLLQAMEWQWLYCMERKKDMLESDIIRPN